MYLSLRFFWVPKHIFLVNCTYDKFICEFCTFIQCLLINNQTKSDKIFGDIEEDLKDMQRNSNVYYSWIWVHLL